VKRTLRDDGTLWLNIGDAYTSGGRTWRDSDKKNKGRAMDYRAPTPDGLKPKDLIGVPWRVAFALEWVKWFPVDPPARQGAKLPVRIPGMKVSIAVIAEA
jgi:site-specific DNA-methyltransferase (cytosine-N4-specific)